MQMSTLLTKLSVRESGIVCTEYFMMYFSLEVLPVGACFALDFVRLFQVMAVMFLG